MKLNVLAVVVGAAVGAVSDERPFEASGRSRRVSTHRELFIKATKETE